MTTTDSHLKPKSALKDIPILQISLLSSLDPARHIELGRALAPLREEGVLIFGSGLSFHNMGAFRSSSTDALAKSEEFDRWIGQVVTNPTEQERLSQLADWESAPRARFCHPREEHLLPLMVIAGAGHADPGKVVFNDLLLGARVSSVQFG
eukprot:c16975_g1_i3.p1 GENE.c16975_g1_i3~~c16975_g1_i3.p1  ORF type:complete len:151 (-),score=20.78 c16975_g1_i3:35-487(-)